MENGTRTYNFDFRRLTRRESEIVLRMGAAHLQVDAGQLFSELTLAAFAYVQVRPIMGYRTIVSLVIRGAYDNNNTMQMGTTMSGRMFIYTPDNTPGSMATGVIVYNNMFLTADYALRAFTRMEQQMEREIGIAQEE